jgi:hypothetical protein
MLDQLKEIREKLNQLIHEVERLEDSLKSEEIIIEKKDFKFIKRRGTGGYGSDNWQIFEFKEGIFFDLHDHVRDEYQYHTFKSLLDGTLKRIILLKRKHPLKYKSGKIVTHKLEDKYDTILRDTYNNV